MKIIIQPAWSMIDTLGSLKLYLELFLTSTKYLNESFLQPRTCFLQAENWSCSSGAKSADKISLSKQLFNSWILCLFNAHSLSIILFLTKCLFKIRCFLAYSRDCFQFCSILLFISFIFPPHRYINSLYVQTRIRHYLSKTFHTRTSNEK